jgi:hypothetical protein
MTQVLNQRFHRKRRKLRVLLNKKIEPFPVDLRESASGFRHSVGNAWPLFDQRCLANEGTFPCGFDIISNPDVDFPFQ